MQDSQPQHPCRASKTDDRLQGLRVEASESAMHRWGSLLLCLGIGLLATGCPKGKTEFKEGKKAETLQDYDAALTYYQKAVKADPYNANFKIKLDQIRFETGALHVKQGLDLRKKGDLQGAASEFQRAETADPSSPIAEQEL